MSIPQAAIILGVDGGNTKTIALVARRDGTIVGAGRAGCGDIYGASSAEAALDAVETAVMAALSAAGVAASAIEAGCFSLAGADWPEDFVFLREALAQRGLGRQAIVVNDAIGALYAGAPRGPAVAVVCGTGAAIGARGHAGQVWHTSFWQEPQGARELGAQALRAVLRAELGIDPPTALREGVLAHFGLPGVEDVLHELTRRVGRRALDTGALARVLLDSAGAGDASARRIVVEHGAALGDYALAAARQVGIVDDPFTLVLAGGVLRHPDRLLAGALIRRVHEAALAARPCFSRFEPTVGALFMAFEAAGIAVDEPLLERLAPTLPPPELFAT